ncbi:unnamed protein product [Amoebophrya sp. A120]|nr:unnamed protein product [Amoebophrya sp. A120]|eukprot:GSA120T00014737001.1
MCLEGKTDLNIRIQPERAGVHSQHSLQKLSRRSRGIGIASGPVVGRIMKRSSCKDLRDHEKEL